MKIILTGSTGFIGSAVLHQALSHPAITQILALSRRPLEVTHPKLSTILIKDWLTLTPEILSQLEGAEACIWVLGTPTSPKEVHVDYTLAAARAFGENLAPKVKGKGRVFRFVYVSGALGERDQSRSLWFLSEPRKLRGGVENTLVEYERELQNEHGEGSLRSFSARPWMVTQGESLFRFVPGLSGMYILVQELARALLDIAVSGEGEHHIENGDLRRRAQEALQEAQ